MNQNERHCFSYLILLAFIAGLPAFSEPWQCRKTQWDREPELVDGVYHSTLVATCALAGVSQSNLQELYEAIETTIFSKSDFLSPPKKVSLNGLSGQHFDVRNLLVHDGDRLETHEDIFLVMNKQKLRYQTRSRKVVGEGMAGYLKKVEFEADFAQKDSNIVLTMKNTVLVERPWYALAPLFTWIAGNISKSKFEEIQNRLLPFFSKSLS